MSVPNLCTQDDVESLLGSQTVVARMGDDDPEAVGLSPDEVERLNTKGIPWASANTLMYLAPRYVITNAANSLVANEATTVTVSRWLCLRRENGVPESLETYFQEIVKNLERVRSGQLILPDLPLKVTGLPRMSIVRVDPVYRYNQMRVVRINNMVPRSFIRNIDWPSEFLTPAEY